MKFILIAAAVISQSFLPKSPSALKKFIQLAGGELIAVRHKLREVLAWHQAERPVIVVGHDAKGEQLDAIMRTKEVPAIEKYCRCLPRGENRTTAINDFGDEVASERLGNSSLAKRLRVTTD